MGIKNVIGELQVNGSPVITEELIENTRVVSATAADTASATAAWNKENSSFDFTFGLPKGNPGEKGDDGQEVQLQKTSTHIQWKYENDTTWKNLVALSDITGDSGEAGKSVELQKTSTHIQWKQTGGSWSNLVALSDLKGAPGSDANVTKANVEAVLTGNIASHTHSYIPKVSYEWNDQVWCATGDSGAFSLGRYKVYDTQLTFDIVSTTSQAISGKLVIATQNGVIKQAKVYGDSSGDLASKLRIYQSAVGSDSTSWIEVFGMFAEWSKNKIHVFAVGLNSSSVQNQFKKVTRTKTSTSDEPNEITSGDTKWNGTVVDVIQASDAVAKGVAAYDWGDHSQKGYLTSTWSGGITQNSASGILFNNGNAKLTIYNTSSSPTDYAAIQLRSTNDTKRNLFIDLSTNSLIVGAANANADSTYKVKIDGTLGVTGQITSTLSSGAPFSVASSTVVTNLNADKLDGKDATGFALTPKTESTAIFSLIGVDNQQHGNTTYYADSAYVESNTGKLVATKVGITTAATLEYDTGKKALKFIFG